MIVKLEIETQNGTLTYGDILLSPYSYQTYPKTPSALKGVVLGISDTPVALTKGRGRYYLYFRLHSRVEWMPLAMEAFRHIREGCAFTISECEPATSAAPAAPATSAAPAATGRRGKK